MTLHILFAAPNVWTEYRPLFSAALTHAGIEARVVTETDDPASIDYIVYAPSAPLQDFRPFTRVKAVLSLWAGVERVVNNHSLTQPLCRMVEDGLTEGMVEWVVGHVLRHHLGMDAHIRNPNRIWDPTCPPLARQRPVTILGLGALGTACAQALTALNFPVAGWSRSAKDIPGIACHSGDDGLAAALKDAEIVVTLLPKTAETENLINARTLAMMRPAVILLNPGRGALIDDDALLAALRSGHVGHATLDVFRTEPLPHDHAYWSHPNVTVTPHIAADSRPDGVVHVLVENIRRGEAGEPFLHQVDRKRGY